jgi:hypothetical protein
MKTYIRNSYSKDIILDVGQTYEFDTDEYVDCLLEKRDPSFNPKSDTEIWRADVFYKPGLPPTVLTYEFTAIEISDIPNAFCIFDSVNKLVLKNNEASEIHLRLTRRA